MIRKSDWDAAIDAHLAERRRAAGPPPTAEEIEAFFEGTLSAAETERIRESLICYPELARAATMPIEQTGGAPLSDADVASDWNAIAHRVGIAAPSTFWRSLAIAASILAFVLGAVLVQTKLSERRLNRELQSPQPNVEPILLLPDGSRGVSENVIELPPPQANFVLVASLINVPQYSAYGIEIVSGRPPARTFWRADNMLRRADDTVTVLVPKAFLPGGTYTLVVSGMRGTASERLATYTFRIPPS